MAEAQHLKWCRSTSQELKLMFISNIRMRENVIWKALVVSDLLATVALSHSTVSSVHTERGKKGKWQFCKWRESRDRSQTCFCAGRKAMITQTTTLCKRAEQKSMSQCARYKTLRCDSRRPPWIPLLSTKKTESEDIQETDWPQLENYNTTQYETSTDRP